MDLIDRRTVSVLTTVLVFAGILALLYFGRRTLIVFLFAIFFAYIIEPLVDRATNWLKGRRVAAIALVYGGLVAAIVVLGLSVGPKIVEQGSRLSQNLPTLVDQFGSGEIVDRVGSRRGWGDETISFLKQLLMSHRNEISTRLQSAGTQVAGMLTGLGWLLLVPILAVFFLKDKSKFRSDLVMSTESRTNRRFMRSLISDLENMLGTYIRSQLLLGVFAFVAYTAFFLIIGFPYSFAIATLGGILELIPFVGPLITASIVIGISFVTGYSHWLVLLIFLGAWRVTQDYVTAPMLFRRGLEMHPLLIIFLVLLGGEVGGVIGMFLAIPAAAAIRIVYDNWTKEPPTAVEDRAA
jgi:predicted PurR-regulated permease PerM